MQSGQENDANFRALLEQFEEDENVPASPPRNYSRDTLLLHPQEKPQSTTESQQQKHSKTVSPEQLFLTHSATKALYTDYLLQPTPDTRLVPPTHTQLSLETLTTHLPSLSSLSTPFNTFAILFHTSPTKHARNNQKYSSWRLTDLHNNTLFLYLFDKAFQHYHNTPQGTALYILSPSLLPPKPGLGDPQALSISVSRPEQLVLLGRSLQLGFCEHVSGKNKCTAPVNKTAGSRCVRHVQESFRRFSSSRMDVNNGGLHHRFRSRGHQTNVTSLKMDRTRLLQSRVSKSEKEAEEEAVSMLASASNRRRRKRSPPRSRDERGLPSYLKKKTPSLGRGCTPNSLILLDDDDEEEEEDNKLVA